jgi:ABC-2 type transport system ATP-binding protein
VSVIEVRGLKKVYRRFRGGPSVALDGLDLDVPAGGVFGFLGPNGSGKTTTIRCLLGLARPTAGGCRLLGADCQRDLHTVIQRVGSIVEAPALFPNFSGRRNLRLLGAMDGIGKRRVDDVLEEVGLAARARDRVKNYSLGMKQRLGIAAALLKNPDVLILDEPANGLDPAGIKEVRELLRSLGKEGRTVFVSSHILSEVQQICDRVAILSRGRLVTAGSVEEVLAGGKVKGLLVRVAEPERAVSVLAAAGIDSTIENDRLIVNLGIEEGARATEVLARAGIYLSELRAQEVDLETVFLELTHEVDGEAVA